MTRLFRLGVDLREVFSAIAADEGDDRRWARGIIDAADGMIEGHSGMALQWFEHERLRITSDVQVAGNGCSARVRLTTADAQQFGRGAMSSVFEPRHPYVSVATALEQVDDVAREVFSGYGIGDIAGVLSAPDERSFVAFAWVLDRVRAPSPHELRLIGRLALHLDAGARVRRAPRLTGVVSQTGCALEGRLPPAQLWRGLRLGLLTLVPRGRGAARSLRVLQNPPGMRLRRSLTPDEVAVLELAARGVSGKQQAWQLGAATTTISRRLASATMKLGLSSPFETIRLVAGLFAEGSVAALDQLTAAERVVLEGVQRGLSNRDIARERDTSERTVANQIASLLRKTAQTGRRGLIALRDQRAP